jgi:endonuclease-3 related protein
MSTAEVLSELYDTLLRAFGHRAWWPGQTPFEVMVGAVLTQNTNWTNVEKAIRAVKDADALSAPAIAQMDLERLQTLIRPSGYYRQKSVRLRRLAEWLVERGGGEPAGLAGISTDQLREELLSLRGIGPETADSILLYALERTTFVVDAYTKRIAARHVLVDWECDYHELKDLFESNLPADLDLYQDYHGQLVELGKRHCKRRGPLCESCPARPVLGEPVLEEGAGTAVDR